MGLSKYEKETVFSFNAQDREMVIYTADPVWMRKLRKLCEEHPENFQMKEEIPFEGEIISIKVVCSDKGLITLRGKRREMSEEQRQANADQLREARNKQF